METTSQPTIDKKEKVGRISLSALFFLYVFTATVQCQSFQSGGFELLSETSSVEIVDIDGNVIEVPLDCTSPIPISSNEDRKKLVTETQCQFCLLGKNLGYQSPIINLGLDDHKKVDYPVFSPEIFITQGESNRSPRAPPKTLV